MNGSDYLESKSNPGKAAGIRQTCDLFLEPGEGDLRSLFQGNPLWDRFITLVGKPRAPDFVMGEVIESGCIFAKIRVCTGRERNRSFAINRLFLPAGAKAAV